MSDDGKGKATGVSCSHKKSYDPDKKEGIYFMYTSLDENDEQAPLAHLQHDQGNRKHFPGFENRPRIAPIYHKTDQASMAYLHLGLLAYWLVATIRYQLKQKGYTSDWKEITRAMSTQKCVTTSMTNINQQVISDRKCTGPIAGVKRYMT